MKYATLGPKKAIFRITDYEPQFIGDNMSFAQVSEEIAATVIAGQNPATRQLYFLIDGVLKTQQEFIESQRPKLPRKQTKLQIMLKLEAMGKWTTFKAVMGQMPEIVQDAWNLAQEINESDPMFSANKEALKAALGITEEQLNSLFD